MTTLQVILREQTNFSYMLCKAKCLYSHGTVPALKTYSNVAIKRRPQVNTEKKKIIYFPIFQHLKTARAINHITSQGFLFKILLGVRIFVSLNMHFTQPFHSRGISAFETTHDSYEERTLQVSQHCDL